MNISQIFIYKNVLLVEKAKSKQNGGWQWANVKILYLYWSGNSKYSYLTHILVLPKRKLTLPWSGWIREYSLTYFLKNGPIPASFLFIFDFFHTAQFNILTIALMVCLGLEPRTAGLKAQTNPLSFGGTLTHLLCKGKFHCTCDLIRSH